MKGSLVHLKLPTIVALTLFATAAFAGVPPPPNVGPKPPRPQPSPPSPGSQPPVPVNTTPSGAGGNQPTITAKPADAKGEAKVPPGKWRGKLDFNKVQLGELVKFIADLTQRNFIVPEKLKGNTVTMICPTDLSVDEAYRAFLSALEVNDITLVKVGKFYKLVASGDAAKSPIPTYTDDKVDVPPNDNIVTTVRHLEHSDATAISNILNNFKSKVAQVAVYQPTNSLIMSEWGSNLVRLNQIITNLDTEGTNDQIRLVTIKFATASEVAARLTELFDVKKGPSTGMPRGAPPPSTPNQVPLGGAGTTSQDDTLSIQKLIPDDRTNQLIIVANEYSAKQLEDVIKRLDVPVGEDTGQVRVIALQNANAEDLASTLSSLATGQPKKKAGGAPGGQPQGGPSPAGAGGAATLFEGEVKITSDKATNSLLVIASPSDFRSVKRMVDQLDLPRRQVFIEAAIMEVSITNDQSLGTQWYAPLPTQNLFQGAIPGATQPALPGVINGPQFGSQSLLSQAISPLTLFNAFGGALAGFSGPGIPVTIPPAMAGQVATTINVPAFAVLLRALQSSSNANVISTPYILALDNEEAKIEVGTKEPFAKGLGANLGASSSLGSLGSMLGGAAGTTANSALGGLGGLGALGAMTGFGQSQIDRIDVSLDITITPHINDSSRVMIEVDQKLEDLLTPKTIGGVDFPVTAKRAVKSKIVLEDQQTVVLGGLIKDNVSETVSGYPILSDIPIIGWLFKTKTTKRAKSNLLIVITPYIVRTKEDFRRIYERKFAEYKAYQDLVYADSKEYKPYIDFARKNGPFATMAKAVRKEMTSIENGGKGETGDVLVAPQGTDMTSPSDAPNRTPQTNTQSPPDTMQTPGVILESKPPEPQDPPPERIEVQP